MKSKKKKMPFKFFDGKDFIIIFILLTVLMLEFFLKVNSCHEYEKLEQEKAVIIAENNVQKNSYKELTMFFSYLSNPETIQEAIKEKTDLIFPTKNHIIKIKVIK